MRSLFLVIQLQFHDDGRHCLLSATIDALARMHRLADPSAWRLEDTLDDGDALQVRLELPQIYRHSMKAL